MVGRNAEKILRDDVGTAAGRDDNLLCNRRQFTGNINGRIPDSDYKYFFIFKSFRCLVVMCMYDLSDK